MPVMDEFREEREALKHGTFQQKFQYFMDYYKWYVIAGVILAVIAVSIIRDMASTREYAFYAAFLNGLEDQVPAETFWADFSARLELDTDKYTTGADTTMSISLTFQDEATVTSMQKLMVYLAAGELDVVAGDSPTFLHFASTDTYFDLREILSPELLTAYEPYLYYVDMDEVRARDEATRNGIVDSFTAAEYDPRSPEGLGDPVPIAICIQDSPKLRGVYYFREGDVPMGFVRNSRHPEEALAFLEYLFEE